MGLGSKHPRSTAAQTYKKCLTVFRVLFKLPVSEGFVDHCGPVSPFQDETSCLNVVSTLDTHNVVAASFFSGTSVFDSVCTRRRISYICRGGEVGLVLLV